MMRDFNLPLVDWSMNIQELRTCIPTSHKATIQAVFTHISCYSLVPVCVEAKEIPQISFAPGV